MAYEPYPQESGTVGLTFIITNGYEGEYSLSGTQYDYTKWKEALKKLTLTFARKETPAKLQPWNSYIPPRRYQSMVQNVATWSLYFVDTARRVH